MKNTFPVRGRESSGRSFTFSEIMLYISVKFLYTAFTPPRIYKHLQINVLNTLAR